MAAEEGWVGPLMRDVDRVVGDLLPKERIEEMMGAMFSTYGQLRELGLTHEQAMGSMGGLVALGIVELEKAHGNDER